MVGNDVLVDSQTETRALREAKVTLVDGIPSSDQSIPPRDIEF